MAPSASETATSRLRAPMADAGLVLHRGVDAVAHDVERQVGEAQRRIGDELDRLILGRALEQQAVVVELAEDDDAVGDRYRRRRRTRGRGCGR